MFKARKIVTLLAVMFFTLGLIFAGGPKRRIYMDESIAQENYVAGEVLVKFKKGVSQANAVQIAAARSLKIKKRFKGLSKKRGQECALLVSNEKTEVKDLVQALKSLPQVEMVTPNYLRYVDVTPNDTNFSSLWGMHNTGQTGGTTDADIDAAEAWDITTGSSDIVVVVIDSGIDYNHPDLSPNV